MAAAASRHRQCPFCRLPLQDLPGGEAADGGRAHHQRLRFPRLTCRHCLREGCTNCVATPVSAAVLGPWCGECPVAPALSLRCPTLQEVPRRVDEFDGTALSRDALDAPAACGSTSATPARSRGRQSHGGGDGGPLPKARSSDALRDEPELSPQRSSVLLSASAATSRAGSFAGPPSPSARLGGRTGSACGLGRVPSSHSVAANACADPMERLNAATVDFARLASDTHAADAQRLAERSLDRHQVDASSRVARRVELVEAVRGFLRCPSCQEPYGTLVNRRRSCAMCLGSVCSGCCRRRELPGRHQWAPDSVTLCPMCLRTRTHIEFQQQQPHRRADTNFSPPPSRSAPQQRPRAATLPVLNP